MIIEIKKLPEHEYKLIFMPEERLNDGLIADLTVINCENKDFRVESWYEFKRGELIPHGLMFLCLGTNQYNLWAHFPQSKVIYFIIGEEIK